MVKDSDRLDGLAGHLPAIFPLGKTIRLWRIRPPWDICSLEYLPCALEVMDDQNTPDFLYKSNCQSPEAYGLADSESDIDRRGFYLPPAELLHLMWTGKVEANLVRLNESFNLPYLPELIDRKISGTEKGTLDQADLAFHEREYERLWAELEEAFEQSRLPEQPRGAAALNDLLLRIRMVT